MENYKSEFQIMNKETTKDYENNYDRIFGERKPLHGTPKPVVGVDALVENQKDLDEEFQKIIDKNFNKLI